MMNSKNLAIIIVILMLTVAGETLYIRNQQGQIDSLNFRIMSLQYQNNVLSTRCSVLESNISEALSELEDVIKELKKEYSQLDIEHENLQFDFNHMANNFEKLQNSNIELEDEFNIYSAQFKLLQKDVNSRLGLDGNLSRFVTPTNPEVINLMLEVTGGYEEPDSIDELWEDYKALFDWVTTMISYSVDSPYPYLYSDPSYSVKWLDHSVRFPNETLADKTGDCEDQAILLLSVMNAHNNRSVKWCISLKWEGGGHLAVAFPVSGGRIAILDPTGDYYSGTVLRFSSEPVNEAIQKWFSRWNEKDIYIDSVFNDNFYVEFESIDEFYEWFEFNFI
jgi:chaperonin cofactor prefoldin